MPRFEPRAAIDRSNHDRQNSGEVQQILHEILTLKIPGKARYSYSRTSKPDRSFGSNHVDLGGITWPASATSIN